MSGDVFGNGMLLSRASGFARIQPSAIFLDPDPDPAASFAERERLFQLPRSSWSDYNPACDQSGRRRLLARREADPAVPRCAPCSAWASDR